MCHAINETPFLCDKENLKKVTKVCLFAKKSKNNEKSTLQMSVCTGKMELPVNTHINVENIELIKRCVIRPLTDLGLKISFSLPGSIKAQENVETFFDVNATDFDLSENSSDNVLYINKVA